MAEPRPQNSGRPCPHFGPHRYHAPEIVDRKISVVLTAQPVSHLSSPAPRLSRVGSVIPALPRPHDKARS
jgi:hypothetical protein